jgi:hypothetical protein
MELADRGPKIVARLCLATIENKAAKSLSLGFGQQGQHFDQRTPQPGAAERQDANHFALQFDHVTIERRIRAGQIEGQGFRAIAEAPIGIKRDACRRESFRFISGQRPPDHRNASASVVKR